MISYFNKIHHHLFRATHPVILCHSVSRVLWCTNLSPLCLPIGDRSLFPQHNLPIDRMPIFNFFSCGDTWFTSNRWTNSTNGSRWKHDYLTNQGYIHIVTRKSIRILLKTFYKYIVYKKCYTKYFEIWLAL